MPLHFEERVHEFGQLPPDSPASCCSVLNVRQEYSKAASPRNVKVGENYCNLNEKRLRHIGRLVDPETRHPRFESRPTNIVEYFLLIIFFIKDVYREKE